MKKSNIKQIYDKYLWEKCSMTLYYKRIKQWIEPFKALVPPPPKEMEVRSKKYWDELERYKKQPQPKPPKQRFYWRLQKWYSKEEAIRIHLLPKNRKQKIQKDIYVKAYTVKEQQYKKDYHEIKIAYHSEEAEIIRKEYERMIRDIENQVYESEDDYERKQLTKNLDDLVQEYSLFISYNTNTNESV